MMVGLSVYVNVNVRRLASGSKAAESAHGGVLELFPLPPGFCCCCCM
jgi:hypothetical protein